MQGIVMLKIINHIWLWFSSYWVDEYSFYFDYFIVTFLFVIFLLLVVLFYDKMKNSVHIITTFIARFYNIQKCYKLMWNLWGFILVLIFSGFPSTASCVTYEEALKAFNNMQTKGINCDQGIIRTESFIVHNQTMLESFQKIASPTSPFDQKVLLKMQNQISSLYTKLEIKNVQRSYIDKELVQLQNDLDNAEPSSLPEIINIDADKLVESDDFTLFVFVGVFVFAGFLLWYYRDSIKSRFGKKQKKSVSDDELSDSSSDDDD